MTYNSAEEVKQQHIERLGIKLGPIFYELCNELAWLYIKWNQYVELYGAKPSRVDLTNQAASLFFRIVQDTLWEDTLLHISRLTDPPKTAGKKNLTILLLPILVENSDLSCQLDNLCTIAVEKSDFCRDWRNRHIAHIDLHLAMKKGVESLLPASRLKVKECLTAISEVLNAVNGHYFNSTTMFDWADDHRGAVDLLYLIDDGLRSVKERQVRIKAGNYLPGDYKARDI
ncbi:MAG: hypothetical protein A2X56_12105 [Nitrospirae bacterium GWC2_57_13]|nr:MAG: hypothetical protein A2X56_12105 [Nitrospirae bacterium GWC2_57_13]HAS53030.1 hypothetical protein [Nitrospiraceae bacterium]